MVIHFRELAPAQHRSFVEQAAPQLESLRLDWSSLRFEDFKSKLRRLDPRLDCERLNRTNDWVISYSDQSAIPLAEWVVSQLSAGPRLFVGRPPGTLADAFFAAKNYSVDLSSSRVRVGFSRGHLLEVYVLVPLDVTADVDDLQIASELFFETLMGDRILDVWVDQIAVDRISRSKGLMMVADGRGRAESYPLADAPTLIQRGIDGLMSELPTTLLGARQSSFDWTALAIDETEDVPVSSIQPDRKFISTRFPEALKACLMGLPFSSSRGDEILLWLSWSSSGGADRSDLRAKVEDYFARLDAEQPPPGRRRPVVLAGTGFGPDLDYVDLWIRPRTERIARLGADLAEIVGSVTLGFYDSIWADERVVFCRD